MATDKQLTELNQWSYGVDPNYQQSGGYGNVKTGQVIKGIDGQSFKVISTQNNLKIIDHYQPMTDTHYKSTEGSGFQGMAVAPIINGSPDISQTVVVAAGSDPKDGGADTQGWMAEKMTGTSAQYGDAKSFVNKVNNMPGVTVTQLSGYSQSAYMLRLGVENDIRTTVFNGFYSYSDLSESDLEKMATDPMRYKNISFSSNGLLQGNWMSAFSYDKNPADYPGMVLLPNGGHSPLSLFNPWFFPDGNIIKDGKLKNGKSVTDYNTEQLKEIAEGHPVIAGNKTTDKWDSKGRLTISRGAAYSGSFKIKLDKMGVSFLANSIKNVADNNCVALKKSNNNIHQELEDLIKDVQKWADGVLLNYPHLTYSDLTEIMAQYTADKMYSSGDVTAANQAIDKLGQALSGVSSSIQSVANGMSVLDQQGATNIQSQPHPMGPVQEDRSKYQ